MDYPIYHNILARRSIRSFEEKKVEPEKIDLLLKAAMAAPSACNLQPWVFIVVDDKKMLEGVKKATTQGDYNAPLVIVICGTYKHIPWKGDGWMLDCGAAMENMMLEAQELALGTVCVGGFNEKKLIKLLEIPKGTTPVAIIEIGYPTCQKKPLTWFTSEAVHYQKYHVNQPRKMRTLNDLQNDIKNRII